MVDAPKVLVWRGNNFGFGRGDHTHLHPSRVPGYILPARFHTPHTPHDVFAIPTVRQYGILPKIYAWLVALPCIVLRHRLPIHYLVSLCVLPLVADLVARPSSHAILVVICPWVRIFVSLPPSEHHCITSHSHTDSLLSNTPSADPRPGPFSFSFVQERI